MDRAMLEKLLSRTESYITEPAEATLRQQAFIARLAGQEPAGRLADAKATLIRIERLLTVMIDNRNKLLLEMANLPALRSDAGAPAAWTR